MRTLLPVLVAATALLAGCGSEDEVTPQPPTQTTTAGGPESPPPVAESGVTDEAPPETEPSAGGDAAAPSTDGEPTGTSPTATEQETETTGEPALTETAPPGMPRPAPGSYSLRASVACLRAHGFAVSAIRPTDDRLRALRDLAQRTSRQAVRNRRLVGLAFARSAADARLLAELLAVPADPYRLTRRANVVLLYRPAAAAGLSAVTRCLRR